MEKILPAIRDAFVTVPQEKRVQVLADLIEGIHAVIAEVGMLPDLDENNNFALVMLLTYDHDDDTIKNVGSIRGWVQDIVHSLEQSVFTEHPELLALLLGHAVRDLIMFRAKEMQMCNAASHDLEELFDLEGLFDMTEKQGPPES